MLQTFLLGTTIVSCILITITLLLFICLDDVSMWYLCTALGVNVIYRIASIYVIVMALFHMSFITLLPVLIYLVNYADQIMAGRREKYSLTHATINDFVSFGMTLWLILLVF